MKTLIFTALCSCHHSALVNQFKYLNFRGRNYFKQILVLPSVICMYRIIPVNWSSDFVTKCMDVLGSTTGSEPVAQPAGNAAVLIWVVSWCGCKMLWGEKWLSVPGANEPICLPWNNWVHREWNCNFKKFNTVRASIKIPFRLIKTQSTLTNGKDLTVLGVLLLIGEFPFSHNPRNPLFRGAAFSCLWMLCPMAACALHIYSPTESHTAAGNETQLDKINLKTS